MKEEVVNGRTEAGEVVVVHHDKDGPGYGDWWVRINNAPINVHRVTRLRDGGTTVLELPETRDIILPKSMNNPNRTPQLDGEEIL